MRNRRECPRCGAAIDSQVQFCPACGLSLIEAERQALELRELRRRERTRRELQILFVIFIAIIYLGYRFLG